MPEANPPGCQIVRAYYGNEPLGDCPVFGCGTSIEHRPPQAEAIILDSAHIACDAARKILECRE
jgi:hypothetical protein